MTDRGTATGDRSGVTVFYNGACPVCRAEIGHYRGLDGGDAVGWRNLADDPAALAARGVSPEGAKRRMHVIDARGELRSGIEALVVIWKSLPRYRWLAHLVSLPLVHGLAGLAYDGLAVPLLAALDRRRQARDAREQAEKGG